MVSSKPRKQRKMLYEAPLHRRQKMMAAHLSKELREKFKRRSLPVRKGDEVKIMRGSFKGRTAKIEKVDLKKMVVYLEGITRKKSDGSDAKIPFSASNLMLINPDLSDKERVKAIERGVQ